MGLNHFALKQSVAYIPEDASFETGKLLTRFPHNHSVMAAVACCSLRELCFLSRETSFVMRGRGTTPAGASELESC